MGGDVVVIGLRVKANQSVTSESNERETGGNISINEVRARAASIDGKKSPTNGLKKKKTKKKKERKKDRKKEEGGEEEEEMKKKKINHSGRQIEQEIF